MLNNITAERLREFKLSGFIAAYEQQRASGQYLDLSFEDRLSLLVDQEYQRRQNMRVARLTQEARIPAHASLDQVNFALSRGVVKATFLELCQGAWLTQAKNGIITGPTGVGKTYLASVLALSLVQRNHTVRFHRTNYWLAHLLQHLEFKKLAFAISGFRKVPLMIFDEWLRDTITAQEARVLHELFDDRYGVRSCLFISQIPVSEWHKRFEDPTLADAIIDRIVHNSWRLELSGSSMRQLAAANQSGTSLRSDNS